MKSWKNLGKEWTLGLLFVIATFTRIRTFCYQFEPQSMRYTFVFLPVIGLILGGLDYMICTALLPYLDPAILALLVMAFNIAITGGIHLDGYLDTCDAIYSYQNLAEKKRILRDPAIGAFALIRYSQYSILRFIVLYLLVKEQQMLVLFITPILSRALLNFVLYRAPLIAGDMLEMTYCSRMMPKALWIAGALVVVCAFSMPMGFMLLPIAYSVYYRSQMLREFAGLSGDLCGYYISLQELWIPFSGVLVAYWF